MIIGNPISPFSRKLNRGGTSYDSSAQALFDYWESLGTPADDTRKSLVNNTIVALKSASVWDSLDFLYVWTAHSQSASLVDWKNPTTRVATISGTTTFLADNYLKGNGSTGKVNLGYNPGDGGTYNFTQNSASMGVYVVDRAVENKRDLSALNGSTQGNELQSLSVSDSIYSYTNSASQRQGKNYLGTGLAAVKRTSSNTGNSSQGGYYNGSSYTDVSLAIPNIPFYAFCKNLNGVFSLFTTRKFRYMFAGDGTIDFFEFNNIMEKEFLIPVITAPTKRLTVLGNSFTANGTYLEQLLVSLNDYSGIDFNPQGYAGYTTPQLSPIANSYVFPYTKSTISNDVVIIWELTNDMSATGGDQDLCYTHIVSLCQEVRTNMPNATIVVPTMMPRNARPTRQNDADLYDDNTLNGKIRNHLVQDGYADYICDTGSDALMGQETQNTDLTYYNADQLHPNATGYQRLVDNYIYPLINAVL